jgi:hypothetical protein
VKGDGGQATYTSSDDRNRQQSLAFIGHPSRKPG